MRLEFELANFYVAVLHISHYATDTSYNSSIKKQKKKKKQSPHWMKKREGSNEREIMINSSIKKFNETKEENRKKK